VGYQWLNAGYHKVTDPNGVWVGAKAGAGLTGFVNGALKLASGEHPAVQGWYADFLKSVVLPNATMFSYMVAFGECLVGIGLIVGGLTGVAAFFGVLMNTNFLLAGTVSTNPILAIPAVLLILAWRNAGWYGLDRWLLPIVGTPWQPGSVFEHDEKVAQAKL
jgi:thiosulfate dehydrogenase [quinone] large subunit